MPMVSVYAVKYSVTTATDAVRNKISNREIFYKSLRVWIKY